MKDTLRIPISGEDVRRVAEGLGWAAEAQVRTQIAAAQEGAVGLGLANSDTLMVEADGCMVHVDDARDEGGPCGVPEPPAGDGPKTGRVRCVPTDVHCVAGTRQASEALFAHLSAQAAARGLGGPAIRHEVFLGDGADWIWQGGAEHFALPGGTLVSIPDIFHARELLWKVANAVYGCGSPRAHAWAGDGAIARGAMGPAR